MHPRYHGHLGAREMRGAYLQADVVLEDIEEVLCVQGNPLVGGGGGGVAYKGPLLDDKALEGELAGGPL